MISSTQTFILVIICSLCTILTRALPFLIWGGKRQMPKLVAHVADKLPTAIMAILIVYCIKGISPSVSGEFIGTIIALAAVVMLHLWKRNLLLSIGAGTIIYMILIRCI